MRVKRYVVDTMPDAMSKIRGELGADAVILSTKELKVGGFMGMFGKKKIEVIAASEGNDTPTSKLKTQPARPAAAPIARQAVPKAYQKSAEMMGTTGTETTVAMETPSVPASSTVEQQGKESPVKNHLSGPERVQAAAAAQPLVRAHEETAAGKWKEAVRQAALEPASSSSTPPINQALSLKEERLFEELREMKSWIGELARQQHDQRELPDPLAAMRGRLQDQELSAELADKWIDGAYRVWVESGKTATEDMLLQAVRSEASAFLQARVGEGIRDETRIVYIAGPTGVGKTTTIAKLAADQIFRAHKKVGFITADTYRISAIEQLRTYSSILNVPLEVVQSPGDVQRAMQRLSHCDLILMDTAGRNYLNEIHVAELHSLLSTSEHSETYLVLSLTSKTQDMKRITEHFSRYGLDKVIFTKLDETESVGPMYNLLSEYPLRVSYIANGQNVPDDLLTADQDLLMDLILGARPS